MKEHTTKLEIEDEAVSRLKLKSPKKTTTTKIKHPMNSLRDNFYVIIKVKVDSPIKSETDEAATNFLCNFLFMLSFASSFIKGLEGKRRVHRFSASDLIVSSTGPRS